MRYIAVYTLFFSLFITACNSNKKVLPIQQMKVVMWDIITTDEWMKLSATKDSSILLKKENISLYNKIFGLHKISKDEFYNSYEYYQAHPNEMKILLDSVAAFGIKKRDTLTNHIGK
jgi:Domain of unknown function (DUF4296)